MSSLRAATLANRLSGYIVTVILTGHVKADLGRKILRIEKRFFR
tara:strand:+ start:23 stop:154 length:132 start_codon:yes stop_codon:yes gene_type:complete